MRTSRLICSALVAIYLATASIEVRAQNDPRQILAGMIYQISTGTPNPNWYGAQLWQLMAYQTGNTGVYPQLRALGIVQNVVMTQWSALPGGMLYAMTVQHAYGQSYWVFGVSSFTNRIEYSSFATGPGSVPYTLPGGTAATSPPPTTGPPVSVGAPPPEQPAPKPKPKPTEDQSEACRKFPNLC